MSRERIGVRDWLIAAGVAAILLVTGLSEQDSAANLDLLGYGLLTASGLAPAARRRAPVPVLAVTGLCAVGYQAAGIVPPTIYLPAGPGDPVSNAILRAASEPRPGGEAGGTPA
jgi:hypothetical protein